jgi:hypothetical protein
MRDRQGLSGGAVLEEISEADADPATAALFREIRVTLGVPFVSLLYRHVATDSELLRSLWSMVGPILATAEAKTAAAELARVDLPPTTPPIPLAALRAVGLDPDEEQRAAATLAAYAHANAMNLLVIQLLEGNDELSGRNNRRMRRLRPSPAGKKSTDHTPLLPMARPQDLDPATTALLHEMSLALTDASHPILVPSLLRHFGHLPGLLALLWTSIRPALVDGVLARASAETARRSRELASALPYTGAADAAIMARVDQFARTIPRMLVCGGLIEAALAETSALVRDGP